MNNMDGPFGGPPEWDVIVAEVNRLREENQRLKRVVSDITGPTQESHPQVMIHRLMNVERQLRAELAEAKREIERLSAELADARVGANTLQWLLDENDPGRRGNAT